jgi:hypothetical protein
MPAAAWPGTVHRYGYFLAFLNVTFSVADFPGAISGVFFPVILKSCLTVPLFVTLKVTAPLGTVFFESVNLNSDGFAAVTVTVLAEDARTRAGAGSAHVRRPAAKAIAASTRITATGSPLRSWSKRGRSRERR